MSRPEPRVLHTFEQEEITDVLAAERIFAITYQNRLVSLRITLPSLIADHPVRKYKKSMYPNEGSARLQARRLNQQFDTEDFNYCELTQQFKL